MKDLKENKQNESGMALVIALLTLLVLSMLATGMIFVTQAGMWSTANYKAVTQARFEAEAGLQRSLQWFNSSNYVFASGATYTTSTTDGAVYYNGQPVVLSGITGITSNYPTTTVTDSFTANLGNQGLTPAGVTGTTWSYSATATLLRRNAGQETWKVVSQGTIPGARAATVEAEMVIERRGDPLFKWALYGAGTGCNNVIFGGSGGGVDSWDSSNGGTYAGTVANTDGDVGSNGNIILKSANDIGGIAYSPWPEVVGGDCKATPDGLSLCGASCTVAEGYQQLGAPTVFPNPPAVTNPTPGTTVQNIRTGCATIPGCSVVTTDQVFALAPGKYDNLVLGGGKEVQLSAGTYNVNSMKWDGKMTIMSGPVTINVAGTGVSKYVIQLSDDAVNTLTHVPSDVIISYGGTANITVGSGANSYFLLYAPNAPVVVSGGGNWYGAAIANSFEVTGGSRLHYDRALGSGTGLTPGPFRPLSFSRSKY